MARSFVFGSTNPIQGWMRKYCERTHPAIKIAIDSLCGDSRPIPKIAENPRSIASVRSQTKGIYDSAKELHHIFCCLKARRLVLVLGFVPLLNRPLYNVRSKLIDYSS